MAYSDASFRFATCLMNLSVTSKTQSDEILKIVVSQQTPGSFVMHLQFTCTPTKLRPPTIPFQDLLAKSMAGLRIQLKSGMPRTHWKSKRFAHFFNDGALLALGNELKRSPNGEQQHPRIGFSRFAPARKSAQIISIQ
jgi:hypothetical protein